MSKININNAFAQFNVKFPTVEELPANDVSRAGACFFYQGELWTFRADGRVYPACGFTEYSARVVFNGTEQPTVTVKKNNLFAASTNGFQRTDVGTYSIQLINTSGYTDQKWIGFISPTISRPNNDSATALIVNGNEFGGGAGYLLGVVSRFISNWSIIRDITSGSGDSTYSLVIRAYL
jgi:hypothetical protein